MNPEKRHEGAEAGTAVLAEEDLVKRVEPGKGDPGALRRGALDLHVVVAREFAGHIVEHPLNFFRASIVGDAGPTVVFEERGTAVNDPAVFTTRTVDLSAFAGQTVRILFSAGDAAPDNLLEAAVDDVRIVVQEGPPVP